MCGADSAGRPPWQEVRSEFEFHVFLPLASWVPRTRPVQIHTQETFWPGPGSLINHTAFSPFRDSWHNPLYMKKTPPPYTLNKEKDLSGKAGEAGGDIHTQRAPASKS